MNGAADNAKQRQSRTKRWMFRAFAVLVGLSPFLILEMTLRMIGWQPTIPVGDPFVDFQTVQPLFVAADEDERMVTAANRLEYFRPESFTREKQANEFRIVCLGGSTVQGRPYGIETSFTTWLELSLQAADPARKWEVINCGGVSYASYRLVPIAREMLRHDPDLIVLYTGHNEFLEDRSYAGIRNTPEFVSRSYSGLSRLKGLQYLHQLVATDPGTDSGANDRQVLSTEVDALLDYRGGLEKYHRDVERQRLVVEHFEFNLLHIIHLTNEANVPLLLVDPPANLRDCPPFKSEHTDGISAEELAKAQTRVAEAIETSSSDIDRAIELLEQAVAIDPDHAGSHYLLGTYYDQSKRYEKAKRHFQLAINEDICPLRIIEPLNQAIRKVSNETDTPLIEIRKRFENLSDGSIPGKNIFFDHVHPSFHGHQVIAEEIHRNLTELKVVQPVESWEFQREELYKQQWASLDSVYFERGKQRLEGLKIWSEGRSKKIREIETAE